jgi:hypothetical protein
MVEAERSHLVCKPAPTAAVVVGDGPESCIHPTIETPCWVECGTEEVAVIVVVE